MQQIIKATKSTISKLEETIELNKKFPESLRSQGMITALEHAVYLIKLDLELQEMIINKNYEL